MLKLERLLLGQELRNEELLKYFESVLQEKNDTIDALYSQIRRLDEAERGMKSQVIA